MMMMVVVVVVIAATAFKPLKAKYHLGVFNISLRHRLDFTKIHSQLYELSYLAKT